MTSPELLRRIAELPPEKRAQLQEHLAKRRPSPSASRPPSDAETAEPPEGLLPSFGQERLWFLAQLEPESPAYNIPLAVRFEGRLSVSALAQAISEVVRRHRVLAAVFVSTREGPRVLHRPGRFHPIPVVDLEELESEDRRTEQARLLDAETLRPFDLARGPLWRAAALRFARADHTTTMSQNHAVSDGWSMGIFLREVSVLYSRYTAGRPSLLPRLATSYADLAAAQRRRLEDSSLADSLAFWTEHLEGTPTLELPTDRPRPPEPRGRGARLHTRFPSSLVRVVDRLAQDCRGTRFMVLLAVFEVLLARISGQRDFAVGTPVANRTADARPVIGFFVNTLALRSELARKPTPNLRQLLGRVRDTTLNAFAHQHVPFERLVERLQPVRSLAVHPLFQVMMVLQDPPSKGLDLPDVTFEVLDRDVVATKLDLTLGLGSRDGGLEGTWDFSRDLFDRTTIRRLDRSWTTLMEAALQNPDAPVDALPLISDGERHQVLVEWSAAGVSRFGEALPRILDGRLEPAPVGVPGELFLAGETADHDEGTRPVRVAERFLPDPQSTEPWERLARTGRRARWAPDGRLVFLDAVEASPHGGVIRPERPPGFVAPRTHAEKQLSRLWQEILDVDRVGARDDFFQLGGHSLLAARLSHRVREAWNVDLPVRRIFQSPVLEDLAAWLEDSLPTPGVPPPVPRQDDAPAPLSYSQERLWFLDRLEPGSPVYNVPLAVRLDGRLRTSALAGGVFEVVRRHPVLRSTVRDTEDGPVQEPHEIRPGRVPVVDLSGLSPDDGRDQAERLRERDASKPFDLTEGPLWRGRLLRLAADRHRALFTQHHIVSDAWSMGVFLREVTVLYSAFCQGRPSPMADPDLTYADVAVWQRAHLSGETLEQRLTAWERRLVGLPDLELPTDRPRPAVASRRGGEVPIHWPARIVESLTARAREEHASLFMVVLAAFQALAARLSGQTDFGIGTPVANRPHRKTEGVIGFFVNTLVLRADVTGEPTFRQLLDRVRDTALTAFEEQEVPFEKLVERIDPQRSLASSPLFQVLLALQNAPESTVELPGLAVAPLPHRTTTSKFDLTLSLTTGNGGLTGRWVFARDLLDPTTVERWSRGLRRVLEAALEDPDLRLSHMSLTTPAERQQVLVEWNDSPRAKPLRPLLLDERIHRVAQRVPDRVALVTEDGLQVTYGQLSARARNLALRLRRAGAGPETPVWVLAERSAETVTALLAALTSGGFYVPVDPDYPEDRVALLLADADRPVVLASALGRALHGERLAALGARIVSMDEPGGDTPALPNVAPAADAAAYAIYTSGSTGRPKGVVVSHRAVTPRLEAARREGMDAEERILHKASVSFDVSVFEIFAPLLLGARLCVVPPGGTEDVGALLERMVREEITHVSFPPSLLASLLGSNGLGRCPSLRRIMTGGETVAADLPERVSRRLSIPLFNRYGPTEATISVTEWRCTEGAAPDGPLPIGRPIHGARVHVMDPGWRPTPLGVPGEIWLGGPSLARGYLHRPGRTAAAFVPNPFAGEPGDRLYRTGDLGRLRPDGALLFLGRADGQVKIRGHRVELGEVETVLLSSPGVAEAAVVDQPEPGTGTRRLVAWIVPEEGREAPEVASLRQHLAERLPTYMVPTTWGVLDTLPVTPNGKVDRARLASLEADAEATEHVAPRTPTQELVATAWLQVLDVERVGATDDFFQLGGHSLLATRVVARLRNAFGVEVPVRRLFEQPTVERLAAAVDELRGGEISTAPPLHPRPEPGPAPLSFAQERFWFLAHLDPESSVYTIPAALDVRGTVGEQALVQGLAEIVRRHHVLRAAFPGPDLGEGDVPHQEIHPPKPFTARSADLSGLTSEDRRDQDRRLGGVHARRPFDLTSPPLLRLTLLRHAKERRTALFAMHHVVSDAWSVAILVRELTTLAGSFVSGQPSPLPELSVQYPDFAVWQRRWLSGEVLERQVAFWRELLAETPEALELPTDRPRPPVTSSQGATTTVVLPPEASASLESMGRGMGVTPFMVLLAAWSVVLARWARQPRFAVGTPVAGRTRVETEPMIGLFLNTLPLPVDAAEDPTFSSLLHRVRDTTLDAFAHQDVPFEKLVDELQPQRSLSRTPLFQVFLVVQNVESATLEIPGATLAPAETPLTETKFELTLTASRSEGGLRLNLAYKTDLFDGTTARRLLGSLGTLLRHVPEDPDRRVSELPLLETAQRHQVLREWNDTGADLPGGCLHELFDAQARSTPEAVAVRSGDRVLSYAELRRASLALARDLRARGVGPETVVALFLDRSPELIVGMLGTLYAGGAYLPLDPAFPVERIQRLVRDAGASRILTRQALAHLLDALTEVKVLDLDPYAQGIREEGRPVTSRTDRSLSERSEFEDRLQTSPDGLPAPRPDLPAYVIYTSGSTGRPKGVVLPHRPVVIHLQAYAQDIGWRPGSSFAMVQSPSVDAPVTNVWLTLTTGGCLHLLSPEEATDPQEAETVFRDRGIEALKLAPSHFKALQSGDNPQAVIPTGWLILGGEGLPIRDARHLAESAPEGTRIYGSYGPTEAAVAMLSARVDGADFDAQPTVFPLGRPIARTRALVLDDRWEPVPVGALGEIVIAGQGLARGYLGRAAQTAAAFVPDPFATETGARMYRTGDLARFLADGRLEFAGRVDQQIKIRGFRIEPGEVEAALRRLDGVSEAVVQAQPDAAGHPVLVAWATPASALEETALRRALESELPPHMVPSALVLLDRLPRTPHGKLDRKALPAPSRLTHGTTEYVAPRTPLEEQLAAIWAEVLAVERVGVEDDFFDLGGHSLLAIRLVSRIRRDLAVEMPLRRFFGATTVTDLARLIWQDQTETTEDDELARMLAEVEELSEEEAEAAVSSEEMEVS